MKQTHPYSLAIKSRTRLQRSMRAGTVTLGLLCAWLFAPDRANAQSEVSERTPPAIVEARGLKPPIPRPLLIEGDVGGITGATVAGPEFRAPQLLLGFEDYYHPRLKRLRKASLPTASNERA